MRDSSHAGFRGSSARALGLLGLALLANAVALPASAVPVVKGGWNVYSEWAAERPEVVAAIDRQRPYLVRWFVEINKYDPADTFSAYAGFFDALARNEVVLAVQFWSSTRSCEVKQEDEALGLWGGAYDQCDPRVGFTIPLPQKYAVYVNNLRAALAQYPTLDVVWEAWNEPDLRDPNVYAVAQGYLGENYQNAWNGDADWLLLGRSRPYTGGSGTGWAQLHAAIGLPGTGPQQHVGTNGITFEYANEIPPWDRWWKCPNGVCSNTRVALGWINATKPYVDTVDIHGYSTATAAAYKNKIDTTLSKWGRARFMIGEFGEVAAGNGVINATVAGNMRDRIAAVQLLPGKEFLGAASHGIVGTCWNAHGQANWFSWDTELGWWDSAYDPTAIVPRPCGAQ